jgi:FKBP-type peptidyl-prolyl cis-trans isomerase
MYKTILLFAFILSGSFLIAQKTTVPHLYYPLPDTTNAVSFYNEITVPVYAIVKRGVYIACGFDGGYLGLQFNKPTKRKIIFSVAGAGKTNDKSVSNPVTLLASGDGVQARTSGKSGGARSAFQYAWKPGVTYPFLVTALPDSAAAVTIYTAYCFLTELKKWKLIASFKVPGNGNAFRSLYAFHEYATAANGRTDEATMGGNQWVQDERGRWTELTRGWLTDNTSGAAGFSRTAKAKQPVINWAANADSAAQAEKDRSEIFQAIHERREDTTGSRDGVYYRILKEGSGNFVAVTDTVTVFYKGSLLSDGSVFDQTREKPATFPLGRLIKGWQLALPSCKVGGKIRIIIPSGLAYTIRSRSKAIPPNSVLVFDIEVLAAKSAN